MRDSVVAEALTWRATPFHHGARVKGVGVDCAQFLIGVYSAAGVVPEFDPGYYAPDWFRHSRVDLFRSWIVKFCRPTDDPGPGDIALFQYGRSASHGAIILATGDEGLVIHAYRGRGVIVEECRPGAPLWPRLDSCWTFEAWHIPGILTSKTRNHRCHNELER